MRRGVRDSINSYFPLEISLFSVNAGSQINVFSLAVFQRLSHNDLAVRINRILIPSLLSGKIVIYGFDSKTEYHINFFLENEFPELLIILVLMDLGCGLGGSISNTANDVNVVCEIDFVPEVFLFFCFGGVNSKGTGDFVEKTMGSFLFSSFRYASTMDFVL